MRVKVCSINLNPAGVTSSVVLCGTVKEIVSSTNCMGSIYALILLLQFVKKCQLPASLGAIPTYAKGLLFKSGLNFLLKLII